MPHKQFTRYDRERIAQFYYLGRSADWIARKISKHPASIRRELKRNCHVSGDYFPAEAHDIAHDRASIANKQVNKIQRYSLLCRVISRKLSGSEKWTPDLIANWLKQTYPKNKKMHASSGTIYAFVRVDASRGGQLHRCLAYGKRGYKKRGNPLETRGKIKNRVMIEQRPRVVETRQRGGDWESDTIEGKAKKSYLASHVDRKSKYLVLTRLPNKKSDTFNGYSAAAFRRHDRRGIALPRHTLTADNGKEFAAHPKLAKRLKLAVFFANAYHPWERGTNENTNRMVRRWFPKGTDFRFVTDAEVYRVERLLNNRPRKSLGYRTPKQVLLE